MDPRLRATLVFHGVIVILLGLLAGFPFVGAIASGEAESIRAWRMAHLEGVLNGLITLAVGAAGGSIALAAPRARLMTASLIIAAYGNIVASILGASTGQRGLSLSGPPANFAVFALFMLAIVGVLLGLGLAAAGARRAAKGGEA
jgi:hypothetical protein